MRLPNSAHTSRPWRIHEIAGDFRLDDVWELPTPGGPDDFPRLMEGFAASDPAQSSVPRRPRALGDPLEGRRPARLGRRGRRPRLPRADAPRPAARGPARRTDRPGVRRPALQPAVPDRRRVRGRDRQQDDARGHAPQLGRRRDRRLPRPDGRPTSSPMACSATPTWPRSTRSAT